MITLALSVSHLKRGEPRCCRTPVYMSPELINSRNDQKGYDGKLVDVWAGGVLLIVMLLGTFPYDHTENPDPNSQEAHLEVWCVTGIWPSCDCMHDIFRDSCVQHRHQAMQCMMWGPSTDLVSCPDVWKRRQKPCWR